MTWKKVKKYKKNSTRMGFEPTRAEPNGLAVHRLNHSATSSYMVQKIQLHSNYNCNNYDLNYITFFSCNTYLYSVRLDRSKTHMTMVVCRYNCLVQELKDDSIQREWEFRCQSEAAKLTLKVLDIGQWKGINCKQSTRWQHLSRLKASVFFSLQKKLVVMKHSNLYLGLVLPSGGWKSLIGRT